MISLVVWLVIVFLSVTEGIEKNWVKQLVALNAPVRLVPTDMYYRSYYYLADTLSSQSDYGTKTIGEKLSSQVSDPYNPDVDAEIPPEFPLPDRREDGSLKDPVKEAWQTVTSLKKFPSARPEEYEVSFGNLRLQLLREDNTTGEISQTYLSQVSYVASIDRENPHFQKMLLPPSIEDLNNLLMVLSLSSSIPQEDQKALHPSEKEEEKLHEKLLSFFENVEISALKTSEQGFRLPRSLYPEIGLLKGCGILKNGRLSKIIIPFALSRVEELKKLYSSFGHEAIEGEILFEEGRPNFVPLEKISIDIPRRLELFLEPGVRFKAQLVPDSLAKASTLSSIQFHIEALIQGRPFSGVVRYEHLEIDQVSLHSNPNQIQPLWSYRDEDGHISIPVDTSIGDGILIAKSYRENGVYLGDTGFLSYFTQTASGVQEQRLPVYVAGFYDTGFMPVGNKLILVDPKVTAVLRGNLTVADRTLGNGIHVWIPRLGDAPAAKQEIQKTLEEKEIDQYWTVESYQDFEFARPVLQQLKSDKTLFTLIAVIILIVACSNIISMLILLVNDKKKEIGILQSLGASSTRIASIFGVCGFFTGFVSSLIGTAAALLTLKNLQSLVNFLSFLQGHQAFQAAFYGETLPNELSMEALGFVLIATTFISLLAGVAPAIKAARIRPTEILRSE